jgi:hypothetical protein
MKMKVLQKGKVAQKQIRDITKILEKSSSFSGKIVISDPKTDHQSR